MNSKDNDLTEMFMYMEQKRFSFSFKLAVKELLVNRLISEPNQSVTKLYNKTCIISKYLLTCKIQLSHVSSVNELTALIHLTIGPK